MEKKKENKNAFVQSHSEGNYRAQIICMRNGFVRADLAKKRQRMIQAGDLTNRINLNVVFIHF